jgi:hypothetical protein
MSTVAERVAKGVALLDAKVPGWRFHVESDILDIGSTVWCIVGQLFSWANDPFTHGCAVLGISGRAWGYGLTGDAYEMHDLTNAWRKIVEG